VIVLDSDCIVPASYLEQVHESLMRYKVDAFGGADNYGLTRYRRTVVHYDNLKMYICLPGKAV